MEGCRGWVRYTRWVWGPNSIVSVSGSPILVPRVLEVVKSRLCYIVGTVYMDMPLKPNVMEDIARDVSSFSFRHRFFHIAVV